MSDQSLRQVLRTQLEEIQAKGLYKRERQIQTPQGSGVRVNDREVINFCANNYLGLANHPAIVEAAHEGLRRYGYGMASVRFICGTQDVHKKLEAAISKFFGKDDAILYSSCWDANGGLFETLLGDEDAVISDELNHASIIDGIRLCKAKRFRYRNCDMSQLENCLKEAAGSRLKMIATDGVFSMDGSLAPLADICALADKYEAIVMIDDSHATGILGPGGRGTGSTSLPARWAKRSAVRPGVSRVRGKRWWTTCGNGRGRTCSPTRCRRRSSAPRSRPWNWSPRAASCAIGCTATRAGCGRRWRGRDSR
jgi:glycine C-acetyltransferase